MSTKYTLHHLQDRIGHTFKNVRLLNQALTHSGAVEERLLGYERLEFLGDRILGMVIATTLYKTFPHENEGALSLRLHHLVRKETLAKIARDLNFSTMIHFASPVDRKNLSDNASMLSDMVEALIAAVYLDGDFKKAQGFIDKLWQPYILSPLDVMKDAKTRLQEWAMSKALDLPLYEILQRRGLDHDPQFTMSVKIDGIKQQGQGVGPSKRQGQQSAAQNLLEKLENKK